MAKGKNVLTTGDVAKICNVAPRTVSKWFDKGQLKGYRIPGSKDRRIPMAELLKFMKHHNMPLTDLAVGQIRVLIVDSNKTACENLVKNLNEKTEYKLQAVNSTFEAGVTALKFEPHVLLISLLSQDIDAADICKNIRSNEDLQAIKILAITNKLNDSEGAALVNKGYDGYITYNDEINDIIRKIEQATSIIESVHLTV